MAGKRQHYVPRLLQRGFLHDPAEEAERTWLHRRGGNAVLVGIRDVGVEDWFYSRKSFDGRPTLDDLITEIEGDLGATINGMRATSPGTSVDPGVAARCAVHLVMRTDHLRRVMSEGVASLVCKLQSLFTDPSRVANMFGLNGPELSQSVIEAVREAALKVASIGVPPSLTERLLSALVRENGDDLVRNATTAVKPFFPLLSGNLVSKVRDAQSRILEMPPEGAGWVTTLSTFHWTIEAGEKLILPDAVALAAEANGRLVPLMFTSADDATALLMPISSNLILVGISPARSALDLTQFNALAAAACSAFFIGAQPFDKDNLASLIGTGPATEIQRGISEAISSAELRGAAPLSLPTRSKDRVFEQESFSYSVRLADYGDVDRAKEISEVIEAVVRELARHLPLHDLDGFTIAIDYHRALAELDRGDPHFPVATSSALEYGAGVAMPVTVKRNGMRKEHIVLAAHIAESWLSDNLNTRAGALNILVKMLAGVAHRTRFDTDAAVTFRPGPLAVALHPGVAPAPPEWFSARECAFIAPHLGGAYAELVIDSLEFAEREIARERAKSRETGDISSATRRAFECVSAILTHAANWLGHRAGLTDGQAFEGDDLPGRLQSRGLDRWIEVFGRDLAAVYEHEGGGLNMAVVMRLSQHVDRLLWALGIYTWLEEENIRCLVVERGLLVPRFV
jgi:hypothetical protein